MYIYIYVGGLILKIFQDAVKPCCELWKFQFPVLWTVVCCGYDLYSNVSDYYVIGLVQKTYSIPGFPLITDII